MGLDRQEVMAVELGAGLREYVAGGRSILDGYAENAAVTGRQGVPLLPWPNRIGPPPPSARGRHRLDFQ